MTDPTTEQTLLILDSRRRLSLGPLARFDRYLADIDEDGTITLHPAVVLPVAQARLMAQPETAAKIDAFLANPASGVRRELPARRTSPADPFSGVSLDDEIAERDQQSDAAWSAMDRSEGGRG